jgi:rhodanese-related sulfurtransferase
VPAPVARAEKLPRLALKSTLHAPTFVQLAQFGRSEPPHSNHQKASIVDFFAFVSQEWLLVTTLIVLIYLYVWRDRIKSGRPVSPHEVTRLVNEGNAVLVDLRDNAEFKAGHIVGALNIPYAKLSKESTEVASHKDKTIILVDKLGQHAGAVGRFLGKEGFNVRRLGGGIAEWQAQNLPLVKGK